MLYLFLKSVWAFTAFYGMIFLRRQQISPGFPERAMPSSLPSAADEGPVHHPERGERHQCVVLNGTHSRLCFPVFQSGMAIPAAYAKCPPGRVIRLPPVSRTEGINPNQKTGGKP